MYQKIIVPIDHGNRNLKTEQHVFTSGILESDCKPVLGEFLQYNGRYYTLSEQRIPNIRDKSRREVLYPDTVRHCHGGRASKDKCREYHSSGGASGGAAAEALRGAA